MQSFPCGGSLKRGLKGPNMGRERSLLWALVHMWIQCCNRTCSHQRLSGLDLLWSARHQLQTGTQLCLQAAFLVGEREGKAILPACFLHDFPSLRLHQFRSVPWTTASPELTSSHTFSLETLSSPVLSRQHLATFRASLSHIFLHYQPLE